MVTQITIYVVRRKVSPNTSNLESTTADYAVGEVVKVHWLKWWAINRKGCEFEYQADHFWSTYISISFNKKWDRNVGRREKSRNVRVHCCQLLSVATGSLKLDDGSKFGLQQHEFCWYIDVANVFLAPTFEYNTQSNNNPSTVDDPLICLITYWLLPSWCPCTKHDKASCFK